MIKKKVLITFLIALFFVTFIIVLTNKKESVNDIINESINESLEASNTDEEGNDRENKDHDDEADVEPVSDQLKELVTETVHRAQDFLSIRDYQIAALGDSLTLGSGDEANDGGYIGILDNTINHDKKIVEFENFATHGHRTDQLLARLDEDEVMTSINDSDIVLITIGANDIMQVAKENFTNLTFAMFDKERVQFEMRLTDILEKINDLNPETHIYLIGLYNPFEQYFQDIEELDEIVDDWNQTGEASVKNYEQATFIPIKDLFEDAEEDLFSEDNFHPNQTGYQLMAERVLEFITKENR